MTISVIGADQPGAWVQRGIFEKVTGQEKIKIPLCAGEIGGKGFKLNTELELDPLTNNDGSFAALVLGDDIYIYTVQPAVASMQPGFIFSKNATVPTGYTENNSRKRGGFHVGRIRAMADRYNDTAVIQEGILPNSVWCAKNRPYPADPTGMTKLSSGLWVDIYLASEDGGTWPENKHLSKKNIYPLTGTEGYSLKDYFILARRSGKRLLSIPEFLEAAYGSPEGKDGDNLAAWSKTTNTGRQLTGYVDQAVSCSGIVDCVGNVYDVLSEMFTEGINWAWVTTLDTGKDALNQHGNQHIPDYIRVFLAGGDWGDGFRAGSACLNSGSGLGNVDTSVGFRAACDPLTPAF